MKPLSRGVLLALLGSMPFAACSGKSSGAIMLAMTTDLEVPKDVGAVGLQIESNGQTVFSDVRPVQDEGGKLVVHLPSTFAVLAPDDGTATMRARVVAYSNAGTGRPLVLRQAITTIPSDRIALLRLPMLFVNQIAAASGTSGQTSTARGLALTSLQATSASLPDWGRSPANVSDGCGADETLDRNDPRANALGCVPATVLSSDLGDYADDLVFAPGASNGQGGSCVDVASCFDPTLDATTGLPPNQKPRFERVTDPNHPCAFRLGDAAMPLDGDNLDFAIVTSGAGTCLPSGDGQTCLVAVPRGDDGWSLVNGATGAPLVAFPNGICGLTPDGSKLVASAACPAITDVVPACGGDTAGRQVLGPASDAKRNDAGLDASAGDGASKEGGASAGAVVFEADTPTQLYVLDGTLYVMASGGEVWSQKTDGTGAPVRLRNANHSGPNYSFAVGHARDGEPFFAFGAMSPSGGSYGFAPATASLDGGPPAATTYAKNFGPIQSAFALGHAYWSYPTTASVGEMDGVLIDGGASVSGLLVVSRSNNTSLVDAIGAADDGSNFFYALRSGGQMHIEQVAPSCYQNCDPAAYTSDLMGQGVSVTAHDGYVYFTNMYNAMVHLYRTPVDALNDTPTALLAVSQPLGTTYQPASQIVADDTCVYVFNNANDPQQHADLWCVPTMPSANQVGTHTSLATNLLAPRGLAQDANYVYWTEQQVNEGGTNGVVKRLAKSGVTNGTL